MSSMAYLDHRLWTYRDSGGIKRMVFDFVFDFRKYVFVISKQIDTASFSWWPNTGGKIVRRRLKGDVGLKEDKFVKVVLRR